MNKVIAHPSRDHARRAELRRLEAGIQADYDRALTSLRKAIGCLEALCGLCDAPELRAMAEEYRDTLSDLTSLEPACIDDRLCSRLAGIQRKLKKSVEVLDKHRQPIPVSSRNSRE